jgi:hypothetical protein
MYCNACLMILQEDNDLNFGFTTETFVGNGYVRIKCNLTKSQNRFLGSSLGATTVASQAQLWGATQGVSLQEKKKIGAVN